jgi:predicted MFS family arabinose efflux permease
MIKVTRPPVILGQRASLLVSAGVVAHTLWTSAAPAMTYRLYAEEWGLSHTVTTGIFAIYPTVVVAVLIGFGDISDHIGRRATMLVGLGASLAGSLLFAIAPSVFWLFAARALMGVGVGLTAGPSTAAVVEFGTGGPSKRAALITTVAQAAGFAAALLVGGALTQYAPWPTRLSFWVLAALLALLFAATWFLPRHTGGDAGGRWHPRMPSIPRDVRKAFVLASVAMMTAYTHGVLVLSLGGQVAHDLVGSPNAFVNGAVLSLFAIVSGVVGIVAKSFRALVAMVLGALASAMGMGLLALSVALHDLPIFLLATATAGAGYSLLFLSAIEVINAAAPAHHRGGVLSAVYLLAYLSISTVALVLGVVATARGLRLAVELGAGAIAVLSLATLVLAISVRGLAPRSLPWAPSAPLPTYVVHHVRHTKAVSRSCFAQFAPRADVHCREGHRRAADGGRSRQGRATRGSLSRDQSASRRADPGAGGRHGDRRGPRHLALSRRGLSDAASIGIDAERQGAGYHVGTARRARGFCRRHGGRSQRFGTTERPRDCWTLRL